MPKRAYLKGQNLKGLQRPDGQQKWTVQCKKTGSWTAMARWNSSSSLREAIQGRVGRLSRFQRAKTVAAKQNRSVGRQFWPWAWHIIFLEFRVCFQIKQQEDTQKQKQKTPQQEEVTRHTNCRSIRIQEIALGKDFVMCPQNPSRRAAAFLWKGSFVGLYTATEALTTWLHLKTHTFE